jgi:exo-beta-1,3-glucanase (GH17 family)
MSIRLSNLSSKFGIVCLPLLCVALATCGGADGVTGNQPKQTYPDANYPLTARPLPAIYTNSVKAINYSAYRAGGPGVNEIPTDAQITQDLQLLSAAGYTLLRTFHTDLSHENILRVAAANFPAMKFHLGIFIEGIAPAQQATCTNEANFKSVLDAIRQANNYTNVVSVSVGNETSFFSAYMPVNCLKGYITAVKQNVLQPVTADDDYTFYAGLSGATALPDTILPLLDFVSMHTYPMSNIGRWNYKGTGSADAMMSAALVNAQSTYTQVANYISTHGAATNLPIIIGETGWKAAATNAPNPVESCCANPINAKMYFDAMNTWQASGTGPKTIFYFEATDEAWKGTVNGDDGWGLWDASRTPRYALCGTAVPNAPACNSPLYNGARFAP